MAIATGLFTLRGDIFPAPGRPASQRLSPFAVKVGRVCRGLNAADAALRRSDELLHRKLDAATSTLEQRSLLYDAATDSVSRSYAQLLMLEAAADTAALDATDVAQVQAALRAWRRNIARILDYRQALDQASSRSRLEAVLRGLPRLRRKLGADARRLHDALLRLARGECWFADMVPLGSFTLPPLRRLSGTQGRRAGSAARKHRPGRRRSETLTPMINTPSPQGIDCLVMPATALAGEAARGRRSGAGAPTETEGAVELRGVGRCATLCRSAGDKARAQRRSAYC